MFQENELATLIIGCGALLFVLFHLRTLRRVPAWPVLLISFLVSFLAWVLTVLEGVFWGDILNLGEHICYALSAVLLAVWAHRSLSMRGWKA